MSVAEHRRHVGHPGDRPKTFLEVGFGPMDRIFAAQLPEDRFGVALRKKTGIVQTVACFHSRRSFASSRADVYPTVYFEHQALVNSGLLGIVGAMATRKHPAPAARPRNAPATRAAILEAARACFTEGGYEHVGVRDVAGRAGVNAALVIRYFGSKMQLFAEAVTGRFMFDYISDGRSPDSDQIARVVLERNKRGGRVDAVLALVRSAPDPHAAAILKERLEEEFI